ncbi:MAG: ferrous iron transport protein A [Methylotetracoccus sp.]|nr:ferrous iron transport protein A [Methylotetracoccus sp.]
MTMTLGDLRIGEQGRVVGYTRGSRSYRNRLLAMGLTPGTVFAVVRFAPLGDPVEIRVRGFALSLRKDEAKIVLVDREQP